MSMADIMYIVFFFLLRPGEYTSTTNDNAAFTLDDVYLYILVKEKSPWLRLQTLNEKQLLPVLFILRLKITSKKEI